MPRLLLSALAALVLLPAVPASAQPEGMVSETTAHSYQEMIERLDAAVKDQEMGVVTRASATVGVQKVLGETIPGNMVVGVYHPRFAQPMLEASVPAGIAAPIRFYITEEADGRATLSYQRPSAVFAPWSAGNADLQDLAAELDTVFGRIFAQATE